MLQSWNGPGIIIAHNWRCVSRTNNKGQQNSLLFRKNIGQSTDGKLSPNSTPAASVVSSKEPDESCDSDLMDDDCPPLPPTEGQPSVFGLPSPPMEDPVQGTKAKRLKTSDPHTPAHGVGHDPALFGQHIALCSDDELDMYLKEIQKEARSYC